MYLFIKGSLSIQYTLDSVQVYGEKKIILSHLSEKLEPFYYEINK